MLPIVIVGGGISGLATAYYLGKAGLPVRLIEKEPRLGGFLQTETIEGCTVELGPDSFINSKPWARELIEELGLGDQIIGSNDHLRATYIWKHGRFVPMPERSDAYGAGLPRPYSPHRASRLGEQDSHGP